MLLAAGYLIEAKGPIQEAIESGAADAYNKDDCTWRRGNDRDYCPDPDVHLYLYTPGNVKRKLDPNHVADWLRQDYEPTKDNIILIHGYAGNFELKKNFSTVFDYQLDIFKNRLVLKKINNLLELNELSLEKKSRNLN